MGARQRKQVAESLSLVSPDEPRVILATGSYLGEGFDDARLDTLFLAMPISWKGTLQQYVGRLHRLHENKKEVLVYDYSDLLVPMLARMYKKASRLLGTWLHRAGSTRWFVFDGFELFLIIVSLALSRKRFILDSAFFQLPALAVQSGCTIMALRSAPWTVEDSGMD